MSFRRRWVKHGVSSAVVRYIAAITATLVSACCTTFLAPDPAFIPINYSSDIRGTLRNISWPVPSFVKPVQLICDHGEVIRDHIEIVEDDRWIQLSRAQLLPRCDLCPRINSVTVLLLKRCELRMLCSVFVK